jgi:hypothetical protein
LANVKQTIKVGKERVIPTRSIQDLEKKINLMTAGENMYVKNFTDTRTLDATSDTLGTLANYVCTLVNDLKKKGIIQ